MRLHRISFRVAGGVVVAAAVVAAAWTLVSAEDQTPTFRASVDLVALDVQVVDSDGRPIPALKPENFEVSIAGKRRRIASADYIESTTSDAGTSAGSRVQRVTSGPTATNIWPGSGLTGAGRTYILAFDTDSFSTNESRDVVAAAEGFIRRLLPDDRVGLYTFPVGPRMEPTIDHAAVSKSVDTIVGHLQSLPGEFNLTPSEIIDINAEASRARGLNTGRQTLPGTGLTGNDGDVTTRVQLRECGATDVRCVEQIQEEALTLAFYMEGRANEGLSGLRALLTLLSQTPGRKTVVLFSAGMPVADRPGGRPDPGELAKMLGQDAAATNTTIYALHVDAWPSRQLAAETRKTDRQPVSRARDNAVTSRLLEEFSGASGGALIRVFSGGGEVALSRVLRETSSHYLLGIEPADTDRDGKVHDLRVRVVDRKGVTVRSRIWVVIPKRSQG
jgi:VWFA-related protein